MEIVTGVSKFGQRWELEGSIDFVKMKGRDPLTHETSGGGAPIMEKRQLDVGLEWDSFQKHTTHWGFVRFGFGSRKWDLEPGLQNYFWSGLKKVSEGHRSSIIKRPIFKSLAFFPAYFFSFQQMPVLVNHTLRTRCVLGVGNDRIGIRGILRVY